jgi:hypothetical protein
VLKDCSSCHQTKHLEDFYPTNKKKGTYRAMCKVCERARQRKYAATNHAEVLARKKSWRDRHPDYHRAHEREHHTQRNRRLAQNYGLTAEQFTQMIQDQSSQCLICKTVPRRLVVDHDHKTGEVRGLLCDACNLMLGKARDSVKVLQAAIAYLDR